MMVGRELILARHIEPVQAGKPRLELRDVSAMSDRETKALSNVTLEVRSGEILGIAGVSGNGQRELAQVISGLRPLTGGHILLDDRDIAGWGVKPLRDAGLAFIPEERMRDGAIKDFTVAENLILQEHASEPYAHGVFLDFRAIAERCNDLIASFNIKTPSQETTLKSLSGGNIQKLILARELARDPKVLIASQPTRGVDIGATEYIHQRLLEQRRQGTATLLISEDLDEIIALSDRIAVMYEGEIVGIVQRGEATIEELGLMMAGVRQQAEMADS
jgi:simple sugar transport system ATP-binding protein